MFSENSMLLHQQELQLVPYIVKWQHGDRSKGSDFPLIFMQNIHSGPNSYGGLNL